ncbi:hypothetical protein BLNAU_3320 [Blattamonas nauphoetae]|uniref:Uncharacterized protein n=1 Tax=Blattamonas nauphoetae TaxID=2049346 RepID=A0ABQ9YDX2_9EUKA|nr:hypothetical protein BLNAU_3320 [Blattamonas nauphoetae]
MKSRCFFKSTATHVTSATLEESSVEMDEMSWEDCEGRKCVGSTHPTIPLAFSSDGGIELRRCGFDNCRSVTDEHSNNPYNVQIEHDILQQHLHLRRPCVHPRDQLCGVCVDSWERWRVDSERRSSDFETVVMRSCQGLSTSNSVLVSLFFDWELPKVVDAAERQKFEMRICFIERAPNSASDVADVAFAVPESTTVDDETSSLLNLFPFS